jgi:hypothetical protein
MGHVQRGMDQNEKGEFHHRTLLSHLIAAQDPETGEKLSAIDIGSEAFGILIAGSHTTAASLTLLLYHLLHNPDAFAKLSEELDAGLPHLPAGAYPYTGLENRLPYMMACVREGFRMSPVFTMPLTRAIVPPEGMVVDGEHLPQGVSLPVFPLPPLFYLTVVSPFAPLPESGLSLHLNRPIALFPIIPSTTTRQYGGKITISSDPPAGSPLPLLPLPLPLTILARI